MKTYTIEFYDHADQKADLTFSIDDTLDNAKEQVKNLLVGATNYAYAMVVSPKGYNVHIVKP